MFNPTILTAKNTGADQTERMHMTLRNPQKIFWKFLFNTCTVLSKVLGNWTANA